MTVVTKTPEETEWLSRQGVEPNASITPDKKWVIFTGQFAQGQRHVYAVATDKVK